MFTLHEFIEGPIETNCFVLRHQQSNTGVLIDAPYGSANRILAFLREAKITLRAILLTHGHWDHAGDAASLKEATNAMVVYHEHDAYLVREPMRFIFPPPTPVEGIEADILASAHHALTLDLFHFDVYHVPGHTPGHIAFYHKATGSLFSGDVLFRGSIGRTDFDYGSYEALMESITVTLAALPSDTVVYSGHGPSTTLGAEFASNPFIREYLETQS